MATSNGMSAEGCFRCQKNEASIECSDCIVDTKCSLYCDECYLIVHKGGLSKHNFVTLSAKLFTELENKARSLESSLNVERLRVRIEAECERQKSEIDIHLSQAQNEVKTLCNVLRNSIDTQESTLMLNISQIRNVRQTELEDLRSHSIQSLHETELEMRETLERLKQATPDTPKLDLLMLKHELERFSRSGLAQAPILPCTTCVSLPDMKRLDKTLTSCLNTMPITNLWKINVSKEIKVVYIQESSCRFFLMDRQQSSDQVAQTVLYHNFRIHDSFRNTMSPITSPDVGQLCIVVSKNNCLMRAIIEGVTDDKHKVKVFYLDVGDSGIVDNSQKSCVFPLDEKLLFYPFTCYYCQIDLDYDNQDRTIERQIRWFLRDLTPKENGLTACLKRKEFLKSGIALHYIDLKDNESSAESDPLMTQLQERVDKVGIGRTKPDNIKYQDIRVLQNSHEGVPLPPVLKNAVPIDPTFGYPTDISIVQTVQYPSFRAMPYVPTYSYQTSQQMPSIYYPGYLPMTAVRSHHTPPPPPSEQSASSPLPPMPRPPSPHLIPEDRPRVPVGAKAVTNSVTDDPNEDIPRTRQDSNPDEIMYGDLELVVEELEWDNRALIELKNMDNSFWKIDLEATLNMKLATSLNQNGTFWALQQHTQEFRMEIFDHLFEQLQTFAETHNSPTKQSFKVGSICAAQFYLDKKWYRALVELVEEGKSARVRFLDYGNSQITQLEHLLHLPPQFCQLPFQAVLCSMDFTTDVILTKTRRDRFSELLEEEGAKHFSCVVKRIEGPIHFVHIYKPHAHKTNSKLDINEEVFLSDLHVPDMELTNKSWADAMKSPSSPENQPPFPPSSSGSERTHPLLKSQRDQPEEYNGKRHEPPSRPSDYSDPPVRNSYQDRMPPRDQDRMPPRDQDRMPPRDQDRMPPRDQDRMPPRDQDRMPPRDQDNEYQRGGGYHHQQQNRYQSSSYHDRNNRDQGRQQNWRPNDSWRGDFSRPRAMGPYPPCSPSLYLKCDYFANNPPSVIQKTMIDILKEYQDHITHIVPDAKSGGPILFLDLDSHQTAIEIMQFLNNKVKQIDEFDLRAELAKRYRLYLEANK